MAESLHDISRSKVCFCGKTAIRLISSTEQTKINEGREEKIDFDAECVPSGICKNCTIKVRTKKQIKVGLWKEHIKGIFVPA